MLSVEGCYQGCNAANLPRIGRPEMHNTRYHSQEMLDEIGLDLRAASADLRALGFLAWKIVSSLIVLSVLASPVVLTILAA